MRHDGGAAGRERRARHVHNRAPELRDRPVILFGATSSRSFHFLLGFPEYLVEQGWEVVLVGGPGGGSEQLVVPGVTAYELPMSRRPAPVSDLRSLVGWIGLMGQLRPDVVVLATPKAALLGLIAAVITGVPVRICHLYGLRLETASGACRAILSVLEWISAQCATRVLSVSPSLSNVFTERGLARPQKIDILGSGSSHGVDTAWFSPERVDENELAGLREKYGLNGERPVIGFVGRIEPDKGLETLAAALELLAARSVDVDLLVVGVLDRPGYDPFKTVGDRTVRVGGVEDTRPYFTLMDVLCLPTFREGMPNVCLEAASMGVPVVTTTATGAVDSVLDGETGVAVRPGDHIALAAALARLVMDSELSARLGDRGRTWVEQYFSRRNVWDALNAYFRSQLELVVRNRKHRRVALSAPRRRWIRAGPDPARPS